MAVLPHATLGLVEHHTAPKVAFGSWSPWFTHRQWLFEYADHRGLRQQVGRATFDRLPLSWHVYAPGTGYRERFARCDCVREELWFFADLEPAPAPLGGRPFTVLLDPEERLVRLARSMHQHQQAGRTGQDLVQAGLLLAALGEVVQAGRGTGSGTVDEPWLIHVAGPREPELVRRIDAEVLRDLAHPPGVADLAGRLGCSESALAHGLRREAGITVLSRVRWLRIREAQRRLVGGDPVKAVAAQLGFASASNFAQVFRQVTGQGPAEYQAWVRARRAGSSVRPG